MAFKITFTQIPYVIKSRGKKSILLNLVTEPVRFRTIFSEVMKLSSCVFLIKLRITPTVFTGIKGLFNSYVTLSRLYAKFHWLISHVQLSFQPLSVTVLPRVTDSLGDTAVPGRIYSPRAPTWHRGKVLTNSVRYVIIE